MRAVVQRVLHGSVEYENTKHEISKGYVLLVGIEKDDNENDVKWLANKIINLRIFPNESGKFDKSIRDVNGEILVVSQFTLLGDATKGNRPDFTHAAKPEIASRLYEQLINQLKLSGLNIKSGKFGAYMIVKIHNDGPVTIILDSKRNSNN